MGTELGPNEEDPGVLWAEIHRLRAAVQGPDGFDTWQQAATAERVRRVAAEKLLAQAEATPPTPEQRPAEGEPAWMAAFDEARDAILNDRGALEGEAMTDTQTNAVLGILDAAFMPHLKRTTPAAERQEGEK